MNRVDESYGRFQFSTGKVVDANGGVIGISSDLDPSEGWDGGTTHWDLTPAEKVELADYMIWLWQAYRKEAQP